MFKQLFLVAAAVLLMTAVVSAESDAALFPTAPEADAETGSHDDYETDVDANNSDTEDSDDSDLDGGSNVRDCSFFC